MDYFYAATVVLYYEQKKTRVTAIIVSFFLIEGSRCYTSAISFSNWVGWHDSCLGWAQMSDCTFPHAEAKTLFALHVHVALCKVFLDPLSTTC